MPISTTKLKSRQVIKWEALILELWQQNSIETSIKMTWAYCLAMQIKKKSRVDIYCNKCTWTEWTLCEKEKKNEVFKKIL